MNSFQTFLLYLLSNMKKRPFLDKSCQEEWVDSILSDEKTDSQTFSC